MTPGGNSTCHSRNFPSLFSTPTSKITSSVQPLRLRPPLCTKRLREQPKPHEKLTVSLKLKKYSNDDFSVHMSFKNGEIQKGEMIITPNGREITVIPNGGRSERYSYEELSKKDHIEKYNYAAKYVLGLRRNTPKMTSFVMCESAACYLMENDPNPDFRMDFYDNGVKICYRHDQEKKIRIIEPRTESHAESQIDYDEQNLPRSYHDKCKLLLEMKTEMLRREKLLQDNGFGFPNIDGRRPSRK